jgi:hypothetical protein
MSRARAVRDVARPREGSRSVGLTRKIHHSLSVDAEAIPGGEERVVGAVPEHGGELAAQVAQAGRAEVFVGVQGDLAIGARAEAVAPAFEVALRALEVVDSPLTTICSTPSSRVIG